MPKVYPLSQVLEAVEGLAAVSRYPDSIIIDSPSITVIVQCDPSNPEMVEIVNVCSYDKDELWYFWDELENVSNEYYYEY